MLHVINSIIFRLVVLNGCCFLIIHASDATAITAAEALPADPFTCSTHQLIERVYNVFRRELKKLNGITFIAPVKQIKTEPSLATRNLSTLIKEHPCNQTFNHALRNMMESIYDGMYRLLEMAKMQLKRRLWHRAREFQQINSGLRRLQRTKNGDGLVDLINTLSQPTEKDSKNLTRRVANTADGSCLTTARSITQFKLCLYRTIELGAADAKAIYVAINQHLTSCGIPIYKTPCPVAPSMLSTTDSITFSVIAFAIVLSVIVLAGNLVAIVRVARMRDGGSCSFVHFISLLVGPETKSPPTPLPPTTSANPQSPENSASKLFTSGSGREYQSVQADQPDV